MKKFSNKQIAFSIIYIIRKKFGLNEKIFREEFADIIFEYEYEIYEKCVIFIEEYLEKNNKLKKNNLNNLIEEKTKEDKDNINEIEEIKIMNSLSPEIKINNKIKYNLLQRLKPLKLKTILNNVNSNKLINDLNLNDIDEKKFNSPILNPQDREKNENLKINLNLKNYGNIRNLLENQRNNTQLIKKSSRNLQKNLNYTNSQFYDNNKNNLFNQIDKPQEKIHTRILSEENLTTLKKINDLERIKVNNNFMNNGLSLNKQNNNNNTNYFNKTTKNFTNKNQNNINLKLSFNIIKK